MTFERTPLYSIYHTLLTKVSLDKGDRLVIEPTEVQRRVLVLLKKQWQERGGQPNLNDVAKAMGMHYVSLKQHFEALDAKGYLTFETQGRGKPPIIRLSEQEEFVGSGASGQGVPLLGDIAAGGLHEAVEHLEGFLMVSGGNSRFALRVKGDSMSEPIQDGDIVILKKSPYKSGDICAVRHEDETTLKYLDLRPGGTALLRPHNPEYDPIEVDLTEVYVAGVYDALLRGAIVDELFREAA